MLVESNCIRTEFRETGTQKQGRYKKRETLYIFKCIECPAEISVRKSDFDRMSGRCRKCADTNNAVNQSLARRGKPFQALYNRFIYDRKRFKQACSITYEDFLGLTDIKLCRYCQDEVNWAEYSLVKNGYRYNLDRMDNTRGYHMDNVVVCCWDCNEMKSDKYSYKEFLEIGKVIYGIKRQRNYESAA